MGLPSSCGISIGRLPKGARNLITDVKDVQVGHCTIHGHHIHTGVTVVLPHPNNLFQEKVLAASHVLNGFGKTAGLVQVEELGTIETPIALTNTLSVGTVWEALVKVLLEQNPDIGVSTGTVNPLVAECNDGSLNDIRGLHVKEKHLGEALANASSDFAEGSVGAGAGMICLGFKGGIGSSSRKISVAGKEWTLGALVLSNFGAKGHLILHGNLINPQEMKIPLPAEAPELQTAQPLSSHHALSSQHKDQGSIIMLLATDLPLSERQLKRLAKRSAISLGRTGSSLGNGSGDICIAFSTSQRIPHKKTPELLHLQMVHEEEMDTIFEAVIEAVEESILSSLWHSPHTVGIRDHQAPSFREWWEQNGFREGFKE